MSEQAFLKILEEFSLDRPATSAASRAGVSVRSVNDIYMALRLRIVQTMAAERDAFNRAGSAILQQIGRDLREVEDYSLEQKREIILVKCAGYDLARRIPKRHLRIVETKPHLSEIFARTNTDHSHRRGYKQKVSAIHVATWLEWRDGNVEGFKRLAQVMGPPDRDYVWSGKSYAFPSLYSELRELLFDRPLRLTERFPPG